MSGDGRGVEIARHLAGASARLDVASEESADLVEVARDHLADLGIVRRHVERRIDQQAALAVAVGEGPLDDLGKKSPDGLFRPAVTLQPGDAFAHRAVGVAGKCGDKQGALAAIGIVEAGAADAHAFGEVAHRGRLVAARPETIDGAVDGLGFVEFLLAAHFASKA